MAEVKSPCDRLHEAALAYVEHEYAHPDRQGGSERHALRTALIEALESHRAEGGD